MALVAVLLLLMLVSGLGAALAVSATTETLLARNHQVAAQARAVADAGLTHAVALTLARLRDWPSQGFASPGAAVTALLRGPDDAVGSAATNADNGSLEGIGPGIGLGSGIARPPGRVALAGAADATYTVRALDDDDPALGRGLSTADVTRIGENGQAWSDANAAIVIRAIGYAGTMARSDAAGTAGGNAFAAGAAVASGAVAFVEASIALRRLPAVVTSGALTLRDTALIGGALGSVHANGDLSLVGNPIVSGSATSSTTVMRSGTPVVVGTVAGGHETIPVPPVRATAYRARADFVLTAGGELQAQDGTVLCAAASSRTACADAGYGWVYDGLNGWSIPGTVAPPPGTYYAEGDVAIPGSPGSSAVPALLTVIALGSITITGAPVLAADTAGLLLVTGGDLLLTGAMRVAGGEAQILVREQAHVEGAAILAGQLLVEDVGNASPLVTATVIAGNTTIAFSGAGGASDFMVTAWHRVEVR